MEFLINEMCDTVNNYFDRERRFGRFEIKNGYLNAPDLDIKENQYFRICGSLYNDGIYKIIHEKPVTWQQMTSGSWEIATDKEWEVENKPIKSWCEANNIPWANLTDDRWNDLDTGVKRFKRGELTDEIFDGAVWLLAIPQDFIKLSEEIAEYKQNNKPSGYTSESFGGYSYTKKEDSGWQGIFKKALHRFRKM